MRIFSLIKQTYFRKMNAVQFAKVRSKIADNAMIHGRVSVYGSGELTIGNHARINSGEAYNPIGGSTKTIFFVKNGGKIIIGDRAGISNSTLVARREIVIEDEVFVGGNCKIYDNDFHSVEFDKRVSDEDDDIKTEAVRICRGAFIGAHSIVLKGVTIGEKSVIGAGSVVTRSIPAGEVWAGNPARFIRNV